MSALPNPIPIAPPPSAPPSPPPPLRPANRPLRLQVEHYLPTDPDLLSGWSELVSSSGATLTQTPLWCAAWNDHFGARDELRLYSGYDGNQLVAVMPIAIHRVQYGPLALRVARLVGTEGPSSCFAPAVLPSWRSAFFTAVLATLEKTERCEAIQLGPIPEGPVLDDVRQAATGLTDQLSCLSDRDAGVLATLELPDDQVTWTETLSRNQRSALRKAERKLATRGAVTVDRAIEGPELARGLDRLVRQHRSQWRAQHRLGHFGDWPGIFAFHGDLLQRLAPSGGARIETLKVAGQMVASQYALVQGCQASCRIASRTTDDRYSDGSPGHLSLIRLLSALQEEGVRNIDLGTGHYDYKRRLGATETPLREILLVSTRPSVQPRAQLIAHLARTMNFAYYRLWYCRFAPALASRTRLPRRGLHPWWMRNRLS